MGLPHEPQSAQEMKDRFAAALEERWDPYRATRGDTPGKHRKQVFDFSDGCRLIVSVDNFADAGGEDDFRLHVSASVPAPFIDEDTIMQVVVHFDSIACATINPHQATLQYVGKTSNRVLHWVGLRPWETPAGFGNLGGGE